MKKYKCIICGHIYDDSKESVKFEDLPNDWKCPLCGAPKKLFEEITSDNNALDDDEKKFSNAVIIDKNNVSIERLAFVKKLVLKGKELILGVMVNFVLIVDNVYNFVQLEQLFLKVQYLR